MPEDLASPPRVAAAPTLAVHGGEPRPNALRTLTPPIAQSTTYPFATLAEARAVVEGRVVADDYARYANPTVRTAERKIAALEGAEDAALFSSGMGALSCALMTLAGAGDHVLVGAECYRPSEQLITETLARFGVLSGRVDACDLDAVQAAVRPGVTKLLFVETPSNPRNRVADLTALAAALRPHRVKLVADTTFASPVNLRALEHGAHLVVASATKFLGGHNDVLAGVIAGRAGLVGAARELRGRLGAILDPQAAYLLNRGMKTLPARMALHDANALALATFLEGHARVRRVWYAGLPSHPDHGRARALLRGYGGVVSFELDGDYAAAERFCNACTVFQIAASLGGVESLLHPPALFSYWDLAPEERLERGIPDGLIRLSVGIEDVDDLRADLSRALSAV